MNKKAFTLLEVLLAISLISLVLAGVYSAFWGGISLSKRSEDSNRIFREIRWAVDTLSHDLENMVPYDFSGSYEDKAAFLGIDNRITFFVESPQGLKVVSYYLLQPENSSVYKVIIGKTYKKNVSGVIRSEEQAERREYLVREEQPLIDYLSGEAVNPEDVEVISTYVAENGLRFSFGYSSSDGHDMSYRSEWKNNYIPANVSIDFDFILPEETKKRLTIKREILIPAGFNGEAESNEAT